MTSVFTCPRCFAVSHNPNDTQHQYCGRCHRFFGDHLLVGRPSTPAKFDCLGCDYHVIAFIHFDRVPVCGMCRWLAEQVELKRLNPCEAIVLRSRLLVPFEKAPAG